MQPRKNIPLGCRRCKGKRKAQPGASISRNAAGDPARSETPCTYGHACTRTGRSCVHPRRMTPWTHREVQGHTPMMNGHGKSDRPAVPVKFPNNAGPPVAEGMEGRGLAKGNLLQQHRLIGHSALERVRHAAGRDRTMPFKALLHQIYHLDTLWTDLQRTPGSRVAAPDARAQPSFSLDLRSGFCAAGRARAGACS